MPTSLRGTVFLRHSVVSIAVSVLEGTVKALRISCRVIVGVGAGVC